MSVIIKCSGINWPGILQIWLILGRSIQTTEPDCSKQLHAVERSLNFLWRKSHASLARTKSPRHTSHTLASLGNPVNGLEAGNESSSWRVCCSIVAWGSRADEKCLTQLGSPAPELGVGFTPQPPQHSPGDSTTSVPVVPTHLRSCHCCLWPSPGTVHHTLFLTPGKSLEQLCCRSV